MEKKKDYKGEREIDGKKNKAYKIEPTPITEELIQIVTEKIVQNFNPEKIILFGSLARGEMRQDTDLDLFIIMPSDLRRDNRSVEISKIFSGRLFPMDILVYTPEEVNMSLRRNNPFVKEILEEGRILYAH